MWLTPDEADQVWDLLVAELCVDLDGRSCRRGFFDKFARGEANATSFYGQLADGSRPFLVLQAWTDFRDVPIAVAERYSDTPQAKPVIAAVNERIKALIEPRRAAERRRRREPSTIGPRVRLSPLAARVQFV